MFATDAALYTIILNSCNTAKNEIALHAQKRNKQNNYMLIGAKAAQERTINTCKLVTTPITSTKTPSPTHTPTRGKYLT